MARRLGPAMVNVRLASLRALEATDGLDRQLEFLSCQTTEIAASRGGWRGADLAGGSRPLRLFEDQPEAANRGLTLPDEPWFAPHLVLLFPPLIVERFGDQIREHHCGGEIIHHTFS